MDGGTPRRLRIEVLGPLRAWQGGTPLDLGPVKRQAVLAALLLRQGAVVSHDQLLDSVWGSQPPGSGHKVLASHVNPLRRALDAEGTRPTESLIRSGKGWYRFLADDVRLDVADLTERGDEALRTKAFGDLAAATNQLSGALALFQGVPLANLPGPYAQAERERLLEQPANAPARTARVSGPARPVHRCPGRPRRAVRVRSVRRVAVGPAHAGAVRLRTSGRSAERLPGRARTPARRTRSRSR